MNKVKVLNVKTGKVALMTQFAVTQLKKGGLFKNFEIIQDKPQTKVATKPTINEEVLDENFVDGGDESNDESNEDAPKRTYRKRK